MQIDKSQILDLLRQQGDDDKTQQADQELPSTVDTEQHAGILSKLGLDPADIVATLAGGGAGGLGGLLGGERFRNPQGERAVLDLLAQVVETGLVGDVLADENRMPGDVPLGGAGEEPDGGDRAAVADGVQHEIVLDGAVH